ncbi:3-oxoacyl-[acyl-carrier-protein] synthase 3 [termite gut metagenome]|uniref:3-oxoacyl-[acyl-carrier-protein] synthase 3 n=1 Tax=termite gut metagenome TaxID=433724 RepID=A0A5J4RJP7_9ZZZZ
MQTLCMNNQVYITRISKFLPNAPVSNDEMEAYLGMINGQPSRARRIILKSNGIKSRYYALDTTGRVTHTNVEMAANAVKALYGQGFSANDMELLAAGTASPEQLLPSHGVMIHGKLEGAKNAEVVSFAGSCCTGIQALKYGWMSLLTGAKNNAVCVASERPSPWMQAKYFDGETEKLQQLEKHPILAFEKDFLRWMLSDGAAALLLQTEPAKEGLSFRVEWIDLCSYAHIRESCMYAGAEKDENGELRGWASFPEKEWLSKSIFSLKQDARQLGENITQLGGQFFKEVAEKRKLKTEDIDWFLPHLSSMFFKDKVREELDAMGYPIPEEKWFVNLPTVGNVGSAANFLMLEELYRVGKLQKQQKILLMTPESARFSYGYCLLTVC